METGNTREPTEINIFIGDNRQYTVYLYESEDQIRNKGMELGPDTMLVFIQPLEEKIDIRLSLINQLMYGIKDRIRGITHDDATNIYSYVWDRYHAIGWGYTP